MKKIYRILIATGVSIIILFASITLMLLLFKIKAPKIGAILTIGAWIGTYKAIKPSKKELEKKKTLYKETYHVNGVIKEKGNIVHGKRQGDWDIFNEEGEFIETHYYDGGEYKYTKGG